MSQPSHLDPGHTALAALLTKSSSQIRADVTPELLELASHEALRVSLELLRMASALRASTVSAGGDESSTASAGDSRPCARRTSLELVR